MELETINAKEKLIENNSNEERTTSSGEMEWRALHVGQLLDDIHLHISVVCSEAALQHCIAHERHGKCIVIRLGCIV